MDVLNIGGVPEHFNLPWHLCIENGEFEKEGLDVSWKDFPGGTGAMNTALRNKDIDVAIILTEGIVKDIHEGNPSKIVQNYVDSPLIWGIHVDNNSPYKTLKELKNTKVAISRPGSGSQLMAYVNAEKQGWDPAKMEFEIVGNIEGAVEALKEDKAQYFLWEHFTTKPLVDNGTFRRIADCPTPWPCFVIAVRNEILEKRWKEVEKILHIINLKTSSFKEIPDIAAKLARRYNQKQADIQEWLKITSWSQEPFRKKDLEKVQEKLNQLNLISGRKEFSEIVITLNLNK